MKKTLIRVYKLGFNISPEHFIPYLNFIERKLIAWYGRSLVELNYIQVNSYQAIKAKIKIEDKYYVILILKADLNPELKIEYPAEISIEKVLDILINLQYFTYQFTLNIEEGTLNLVFIPGLPVTPIRKMTIAKKILSQIFTGNLLILYMIFLLIGLTLFAFLGKYAPIGIVLFQFVLLLSAPKILKFMSDWHISASNGVMYIAICKMSLKDFNFLISKKWKDISNIKSQISKLSFESGEIITPEIVSNVMTKWGINCPPNKISIKVVPIYRIIEDVARAYNIEIPRTVIANTLIPNAAITGPSIKNSILLVTSGLALTLDSNEIKAVIGHEFSHAVNKDPLILFIFSSIEYLTRVYILWMLKWPLDLIYFIFSITALFFTAKFLEARADLESAYRLKHNRELSNALIKIGFHRIFYERFKSYRFQRWIGWDPHPPLYFRVLRLEKLDLNWKPKSLLLHSAKDCISNFISTIIT